MTTANELKALTPINLSSVRLTPRGRAWYGAAMHIRAANTPGQRLIAYYGSYEAIPCPTVVVEEENWVLVFYWELPDDLVAIRFDELSWEFV